MFLGNLWPGCDQAVPLESANSVLILNRPKEGPELGV